MITLGELDRRITLNKRVWTQDTYGGQVSTNTPVDIWAKVVYGSGGEKETEGVISLDYDIMFVVRFRVMKEDYTITYEGNDYEIEKVEEIGRHHFLKLHCLRSE